MCLECGGLGLIMSASSTFLPKGKWMYVNFSVKNGIIENN